MSRGYGRTQRMMLAVLEENESAGLRQASEGMTTSELASAVYRTCKPTVAWLMPQAEMGAVRRALKTLVRDGRVVRLGYLRDDQCHWRRRMYAACDGSEATMAGFTRFSSGATPPPASPPKRTQRARPPFLASSATLHARPLAEAICRGAVAAHIRSFAVANPHQRTNARP